MDFLQKKYWETSKSIKAGLHIIIRSKLFSGWFPKHWIDYNRIRSKNLGYFINSLESNKKQNSSNYGCWYRYAENYTSPLYSKQQHYLEQYLLWEQWVSP